MHNIRKHLLRFVVALTIVLLSCHQASAQKFALSTNLIEWANFGTINADAGLSVAQHFSLHAGAKFNPWSFHTKSGMQIYNKQTTAYFGARYWPWYVYSGWWIGARVRFMDFSETGVLRPKLFEGKSLGAGVLFGYTWMIHEHFNIEIGGGLWGGRHLEYTRYRTPARRDILSSGPRNFAFVDELSVSLMYVF